MKQEKRKSKRLQKGQSNTAALTHSVLKQSPVQVQLLYSTRLHSVLLVQLPHLLYSNGQSPVTHSISHYWWEVTSAQKTLQSPPIMLLFRDLPLWALTWEGKHCHVGAASFSVCRILISTSVLEVVIDLETAKASLRTRVLNIPVHLLLPLWVFILLMRLCRSDEAFSFSSLYRLQTTNWGQTSFSRNFLFLFLFSRTAHPDKIPTSLLTHLTPKQTTSAVSQCDRKGPEIND